MLPFLDVAFRTIKKQYYDDVADRLNYYYTVLILIFLALVVSAKQYVGQPIQCWVPAQFRGGWEQYAESYCFVQNTYFLPFEKGIPEDQLERDYRKIGYYQWVPIVLAIQAMMFFLPNMIWKWFNGQSGINVKAILGIATDSVGFDPEKRQKNVETLARYIEDSLALQNSIESERRNGRGFLLARFGVDHRRLGSYLCCLYLFVKFLYLVNAVGQLFLLNAFLGTSYKFWGAQMLSDLSRGREWTESGHFPRVTMCDFVVRELGQTHKHTIQCVLVINMFNEKIYLFLWFWLVFLAITTAANLAWWLLSSWPTASRRLVLKYLRISHFDSSGTMPSDRRIFEKFVRNALRSDGILLLRFISGHAGDLLTTELTAALFKDYIEQQQTNGQSAKSAMLDSVDGKKGYNPQDDGGFTEMEGEKDTNMLMANGNGFVGSKDHSTLKVGGYPGPPPPPPPSSQSGQGGKIK